MPAKYVAQTFVAASPDAMVIGQAVQAFAENIQADVIKPILPKHGFEEIDPEKWYPHQAWMDVLKEVNDTLGGSASQVFIAFGKQVVESAVMPPEIKSIPDVLDALHAIHHLNLQNVPDDEGYAIEKIKEQHYNVYENTPNPSDTIYGFIWGLVARFRKKGENFVVRVIPNPKPDTQPGTVFEVRWGNEA